MNVLHQFLLVVLLSVTHLAADEPLNATQAAERVVIPKIQFKGSDIREATEAVREISWQLAKPAKRLNIILALKPGPPRSPVTLAKDDATMLAVLKAIAEQAGCEVHGEDYALVLRDKGAGPLPPITAEDGVDLQQIRLDLDKIVFPRVDFRAATAREAIEFIIAKQKQLAPNGGASIILKLGDRALAGEVPNPPAPPIPGLPGNPRAAPAPVAPQVGHDTSRISLQASNIPFLELLRYVAASVDHKVTAWKFGFVVEPIKER